MATSGGLAWRTGLAISTRPEAFVTTNPRSSRSRASRRAGGQSPRPAGGVAQSTSAPVYFRRAALEQCGAGNILKSVSAKCQFPIADQNLRCQSPSLHEKTPAKMLAIGRRRVMRRGLGLARVRSAISACRAQPRKPAERLEAQSCVTAWGETPAADRTGRCHLSNACRAFAQDRFRLGRRHRTVASRVARAVARHWSGQAGARSTCSREPFRRQPVSTETQ